MNEALRQLQIDGYVILPGLLSALEVEEIRRALTPLLARQPWAQGEFFGSRTRRLHNVLAKTRATDCLVGHPAVVELVRTVLGHPQVSIVNAIEIHPGETAQPFHQDDVLFPISRPHPPLIVNTMWAITEFTRENGATMLVPKSQDLTALPDACQRVSAEMDPGSVLLWNGGLFHGGGANHSTHARLGLNVNYNCAWLRQQENPYLAIPREVARELPDDFLQLIGYDAFLNIYGLVDHAHPLGVLGRPVQPIASAGGGETSPGRHGYGAERQHGPLGLALEWLRRLSRTGPATLIAIVRGRDSDAARTRLERVFDSGDAELLRDFWELAAEPQTTRH